MITLLRNGVFRGVVLSSDSREPVKAFRIETHRAKDRFQGRIRPGNHSNRWELESEDGRFEIAAHPPGDWAAIVRAAGYQPRVVEGVHVPEGGTAHERILLDEGPMLSGVVIDEGTRSPVPWARVNLYGAGALPAMGEETGQDGTFEFGSVPAIELTLSVFADGYPPARRIVNAELEDTVEIVLSRGVLIHGVVFLADEKTPAAARVQLLKEEVYGGNSSFTDDEGRFEFVQERPGRYRISAESRLGRSAEKQVVVGANDTDVRVDLVLRTGASVRGQVTGLLPGERSPIGVRIQKGGGDLTSTNADENGHYVIHGLPAGLVDVQVTTGLGRQVTKSAELPEFGAATVDFHLGPGARLHGEITRGGKPADAVGLTAAPIEGQRTAARTASVEGRYAFHGLDNGYYDVQPRVGSPVRVLVDGDTRLDIELSDLAISGLVRDASTRSSIANATVVVKGIAQATTDAAGAFEIIGMEPGAYQAYAYKSGYDIDLQHVTVESTSAEIVLDLRPVNEPNIRVRNADTGQPLPGGPLFVRATAGPVEIWLTLGLDSEGMATLPPSLAGFAIQISIGGFYGSASIAHWDGFPTEITLSRRP